MMFSLNTSKRRSYEMKHIIKDHYQELVPVLDYIEKHYTEKIFISDLSSMIHVCDDKLTRLFKNATGLTPVEYIIQMRIAYYKSSLRRNRNYVRICKQQLYDSLF